MSLCVCVCVYFCFARAVVNLVSFVGTQPSLCLTLPLAASLRTSVLGPGAASADPEHLAGV